LLPEQCRAARGLLNWTQAELAIRAGISRSTVRDFEGERHDLHRSTMALLLQTFEQAGIELLLAGGTGVRIKGQDARDSPASSTQASGNPADRGADA
jgi:transcriptional regulator with XRE-family HTH domain